MNKFFAFIILVSVALTMGFLVVPWIKTTIENMRWKPEALKILDAKLYYDSESNKWKLNITMINEGEGRAEIYKVEVQGVETIEFNPPLVIAQGEIREVAIELKKNYTYGVFYTIRLYLKSGTVYPVLEKTVKTS